MIWWGSNKETNEIDHFAKNKLFIIYFFLSNHQFSSLSTLFYLTHIHSMGSTNLIVYVYSSFLWCWRKKLEDHPMQLITTPLVNKHWRMSWLIIANNNVWSEPVSWFELGTSSQFRPSPFECVPNNMFDKFRIFNKKVWITKNSFSFSFLWFWWLWQSILYHLVKVFPENSWKYSSNAPTIVMKIWFFSS